MNNFNLINVENFEKYQLNKIISLFEYKPLPVFQESVK